MFLDQQTRNRLKNLTWLHLLASWILPQFEDSEIDLDVVGDITVLDIPPKSQSDAQICL